MRKNTKNTFLPRSKGIDMATVYSPKECLKKVKHMIHHPVNKQIVDELFAILNMKEKFEEHDVPVPNKVVMFGPPGTGKTLTAFYIAQRLELPLILVRLDAIIHSHLGETASNVRRIFEFAKSSPCILFLDEFDAIARTRENNDDMKEMTRVVNTLLQCLDEFEGDSIFIAATNLEEELDNAIWRRFDTKMHYSLPTDESRKEYIHLLIAGFEQEENILEQTTVLLKGCSFADIEQIVLKAKRKAIITSSLLSYKNMYNSYLEYNPRALVTI